MIRSVAIAVTATIALAGCGGRIADLGDGGGLTYDGGKDDGGVVFNDGGVIFKDSGVIFKDGGTVPDASTCSFTICNNVCVDTSTDYANCGQCNHVCPPASICANSACQCSGPSTLCGNACVDTMTDKLNCGTCNHACTNNAQCVNGSCQPQGSGPPPQGTCSHSLCDQTNNTALVSGCDPTNCVTTICTNDSYCCNTFWDSICVGEVASYCSPYSCP